MALSAGQTAHNTMSKLHEASISGITRQREALLVLSFPGKWKQVSEESTKSALGQLCRGKKNTIGSFIFDSS